MIVLIVTACFIVFDLVSGLIKAFKDKSYNSSVMREGLYHKCGSIMIIALAVLIDYAQKFLDLGFTLPITISVCVYIVLMEIGSIVENVGTINPELMSEKLKQYFQKLKEKEK